MALRLCTTSSTLSASVQELQERRLVETPCRRSWRRTGADGEGAAVGRLATATLLGVTLVKSGRRRSRGRPLRSSADAVWPLPEEDKKTLKQVVIVHRHGTRFPTKPSGPGNLGWPVRAQFWDSYKGHLTPLGAKLLTDTGIVLRKRYISNGSCLFDGVQKVDGRAVAVYTSNVQRTLQSAWSLLLGLVPGASIFFAFRSERVFAQALKQAVGVPIYVEDASSGDDRLFHEWKLNKEAYKTWNKENLKRSDFLNYAKDAPEYNELLDTLFERLQEPKLASGDEWRRLLAAKDVDTQVLIEESHSRPILPNELGEELSDKEQDMLRKIADEVKRCWFGDAEGDCSRSYGRQAAGYLGHKIWRHLDESAKDLCHQRFVQFSCHDTTMCALAAHFGIELEKIGFGAFFALELHESQGSHFLKFYYCSEPDLGAQSYEGLESLVLPLGREEKIRKLKDCEVGTVPLEALEAHCRIDGLEESFEAFVKLLGRADLGPTRSDLEKLLQDGRHGWHTFEEWKDLYNEAFHSFDQNGDGLLCKAEMQDAFFNWYGVRGKITDLIFHLVDREPETDALSEEDVYLAMFALVGVRGSISSKTVNKNVLVDTLLDDPNQRSSGGVTMLMNAANSGDLNRIRALVDKGADVNAQDDFGWTALRFAVRKGYTEAVQELITAKADVNACSKSGRTPLMSAVANDAPNIVQLLVSAGADLTAQNGDGLSAFDIAKRGGGMGNTVIRGLVDPKTSLVSAV